MLDLVAAALRKTHNEFEWQLIHDSTEFEAELGSFKINTTSDDVSADLRWPAPSTFMKKEELKTAVWKDIQERVLPAINKRLKEREPLGISDHQLQQLLEKIGEGDASFVVDHPDGYSIGVNTTKGVDVALKTKDVASMLAAVWLFQAKGIRLVTD